MVVKHPKRKLGEKKMQVTNGENVSTTYDMWYDIEKIEYYNDGEIIICYTEKNEKSS